MSKDKSNKQLTFREAVAATPDVSNGYHEGLSALGRYTTKISVPDLTKIDGSLDIDATTRELYPNDCRWDYALGYDGEVFYIEIHSAITSEVTKMLKKLEWLKTWLPSKAPEINKLTAKKKKAVAWVQTSYFDIPKHTPQYRMIVQKKILPMAMWDYSQL